MSRGFDHRPVMLNEVLEVFDAVPPGAIIDATLGGGGHAAALLERRDDIVVVGIDRDPRAIAAATERLAPFGRRATVQRGRFDGIGSIADALRREGVAISGVLFDLGVSSPQLDEAHRGFSFSHDGPLDMRMDPDSSTTADQIVNNAPEEELVALLAESGEERFARRIVRAIVASRPIVSTWELADVVAAAVPPGARRRGHPARRVFQAIRIAVNDELEQLPGALDSAIDALRPQGRIVVIAYHSGEDRIAKNRLRNGATGGCVCPPNLPCVCGATPTLHLLNRGAKKPTAEEIAENPRAEAARFRAAERLGVAQTVRR
jgi:16S rRNA (cytosine1402-N4)-methyltransferase